MLYWDVPYLLHHIQGCKFHDYNLYVEVFHRNVVAMS